MAVVAFPPPRWLGARRRDAYINRFGGPMETSEIGRLVGELAVLRNECETLAEAAASVGDRDRYPSEIVQLLTEAAKEAKNLKYRILNALIGAGPEVDSWRNLVNAMEFVESYRVDIDCRWQGERPNVIRQPSGW